jgi:hypothetical protein
MKLSDMCHLFPIHPDFDEEVVINLPRKVNGESQTIGHHDDISKNAIAPNQNISFARHELHWSKRHCELLQSGIQVDNRRRPIAQDLGPVPGAASMTLVRLREPALTFWTCPGSSHSGLTDGASAAGPSGPRPPQLTFHSALMASTRPTTGRQGEVAGVVGMVKKTKALSMVATAQT